MPNDVLALAQRKPRRQRSVLEIARKKLRTPEKTVEKFCDDLIAKMGGDVVRYSQARATNQSHGIPDRRYRLWFGGVGYAFAFEVKAEGGKLSNYQVDFLTAELECGCLVACGGVDELVAFVQALRDPETDPMLVARDLISRWSR